MNKFIRILSLHAALWVILVLLSGCSSWLNLLSTLGFDSNDYESETVTGSVAEDTAEAQTAMETVGYLLYHSIQLESFDSFSDAVEIYQNEVLLSLVRENFSRYSGNVSLMEKIEADHPMMKCSIFVPASEYESRVYTIFGGSWKLTNRSCSLFTYLEDYQGYIMVSLFEQPTVTASFISMEETEHTYRLCFQVSNEDAYETYETILIKRDDGTLYFLKLNIS